MNRSTVISGIVTTAFVVAPICAFAQAPGSTTQTTQTTQTTTTQTTQVQTAVDYTTESFSIFSAAVGAAFAHDVDGEAWSFDGSFDYLWRGALGFEALATFTPDSHLDIGFGQFPGDTHVNTYMANVIGAIPFGRSQNVLPFVSGGFGLITVRNNFEVFDFDNTLFVGDVDFNENGSFDLIDDNQFGGNIGAGVMGFAGNVGFRGDIRWFTGIAADETPDRINKLGNEVTFWRGSGGVSFRW